MKIEETPLVGAFSISPTIYSDKRGYFYEWFNTDNFRSETGINFVPVQFNCSKSTKGVLRGLHFQTDPKSQAKVIGVNQGIIQDVIVDVRNGSPTFGKSYSTIIDGELKNQLYIPKGFAHGFLVISDVAEIFYAIDEFYSPEHESGLLFNDADLHIEWELREEEIILSDKDYLYKPIKQKEFNFIYNG